MEESVAVAPRAFPGLLWNAFLIIQRLGENLPAERVDETTRIDAVFLFYVNPKGPASSEAGSGLWLWLWLLLWLWL